LPWLLGLPLLRNFVSAKINLETQVTLWSLIVSFMVAAVVGLAFGIYPALVASRQDPIVALRHD
jgi:putative ABC transport system permease protein